MGSGQEEGGGRQAGEVRSGERERMEREKRGEREREKRGESEREKDESPVQQCEREGGEG